MINRNMATKEPTIDPNAVYISFNSECKTMVEVFIQILDKFKIAHHQSITDDLETISDFEKEIGKGKIVVIFYCKKYFTSSHCMNEYAEIRANQEGKRVYTVKCDDVVFDANFRNGLIRFWSGEKGVVTETPHEERTEVQNAAYENEFYLEKGTRYCIFKFGNYFRDIPYTSAECNDEGDVEPWAKENLEGLAQKIEKFISKPSIAATSAHNAGNSLPKLPIFYVRPKMVIRDEVEVLKRKIDEYRFVNMIGLGGCGKSTLAETLYKKYKNHYNYVTSVPIFSDFYEEFVNRFREKLGVDLYIKGGDREGRTIDYEKTYAAIIDKLETYPDDGSRRNLIVIDVNENANYDTIKNELKLLERRLESWQILVVSRVRMLPKDRVYKLCDVTSVNDENLRAIFLLYFEHDDLQTYYKDVFDANDLQKLFGYLLRLPLLVEQLASFLDAYGSALTFQQIIQILKINEDVFNQDFASRSLTDQEKYDVIREYLSTLVTFGRLDVLTGSGTLLRDIVRHFTIWQQKKCTVDFVNRFVVANNKGCTINEGLSSYLVDKCIINVNGDASGKTYEMHSLIAKACREQIYTNDDNKQFRDFSEYFRRVDEFEKQYDGKNKQHKDYRGIIADSFRFIIPDDDDSEKFILRKAHEYRSSVIYEHILKVKYLKLTRPDISIGDIYEQMNQIDTPVDVLYYSWLDEASGYSSNLGDYKNEKHLLEIDQLISEMVAVKGGTFKMGAQKANRNMDNYDKDAYDDEAPVHEVTLDDFYLAKTPVTQGLWKAVMGDNPSDFNKGDDYPVDNVSWYDCLAFIMKLNEITEMKFRLPTEAQWEFAARGGNKSQGYKYSGSNVIGEVAWSYDNSKSQTHPVKQKNANELGIYDMSGNVLEWCQDWYGNYPNGAVTNPQGPSSGSSRVLRGGSWGDLASGCRVSDRDDFNPDYRGSYYGLRLALVVP